MQSYTTPDHVIAAAVEQHADWMVHGDPHQVFNLLSLWGADLQEADLSAANLSRATLRQANLRGAKLHAADLRFSDLREASFYEADLSHAKLQDAYLCEADLRGADLRWASLNNVCLVGVKLDGAKFSSLPALATRWEHAIFSYIWVADVPISVVPDELRWQYDKQRRHTSAKEESNHRKVVIDGR